MPRYKSKVCPSKYLTTTPAFELSHTDCTCVYRHLTHVAPIIALERWPLIKYQQL